MLNELTVKPAPPELPWQLELGRVLVDKKPSLLALCRSGDDGRIAAWVLALPDGAAVLLPTTRDDEQAARPVHTTVRNIRRRWARLFEADLVQVCGPEALHLAG